MSEYGEPWRIYDHATSESYAEIFLAGLHGTDRLVVPSGPVAKRIVACVNFCREFSTENLQLLASDAEAMRGFAALVRGNGDCLRFINDQLARAPADAPRLVKEGETVGDSIRRLRDAGLDAWDNVADPEAEIREIRGDEPEEN